MDDFTIHGGPSRIQLCRVVYDGLESSPIRRDLALSGILTTDDPREQKRLGRQVRHFDHDFQQQEWGHIVLRGNIARSSQNEERRLALVQYAQRRLAEASLHDKLWIISLSGCNYRTSSPYTWRRSNLSGQALEHVQDILWRGIMAQISDFIPSVPTASIDPSCDTVFEVDMVTRICLDTSPSMRHTHYENIWAFVVSVPDDYVPELLLAHTNHANEPRIAEQGPDLNSGVVTMDDVTFTVLPSLISGASSTSRLRCRTLLDTGSPQSFIPLNAFDQMVAIGTADKSYVRSTTSRYWSGCGSQELLSTNRRVRTIIQFYQNGTPSALRA